MSESQTNSSPQPEDDLRAVLAESDKLLKASEKSLQRMNKMRKALGLKSGASGEFMEHIPEGDKLQKARKELESFTQGLDSELPAQDEAKTNQKGGKKRSKLAKAMNRNLRI